LWWWSEGEFENRIGGKEDGGDSKKGGIRARGVVLIGRKRSRIGLKRNSKSYLPRMAETLFGTSQLFDE
jgi:hypothetical protein